MSVIKNIIQTLFTSNGSEKVVKDTDGITRAQTRLGQTSASNGRQFAAQAQGLGGLVGAYAGAAATVFALQAAFTALSNAARAENIVKGTSMLAAEVGQAGPKLLATLQAITQEQINLADTAQNTNLALSAGFDSTQIEKLTVVAQKASTALGRDLSDSFQRLVKGSAKLEPELLDELGIFTRIDPAVKKYAKSLGVSADTLSEFERRQAFVNAVIEEGNRKFSSIDTSAPSAQKSLAQLLVQIQNLTNTFVNLLNVALGPVVRFFSGDFGNALVLFGAIFLLVFKKAGSIASAFAAQQLSTANAWANTWISNIEKVSGSYEKLAAAENKFAADVKTRGGLIGQDKSGRFNVKDVDRAAVKRFADIRKEFQGGIIQTLNVQDIRARLKTLDDDFNKFGDKLGTIAREDVLLIRQNMEDFTNKTSKGTKVLVGSLEAVKSGIQKVANFAATAFNAFTWIFAITAALELLGIDVLGMISNALEDIYKKTKQTEEGFIGFTLAAGGGSAKLVENLKAVGATQKDLDNVSLTLADINDEIQARAERNAIPGAKGGRQIVSAAQIRAAELAAARAELARTTEQIKTADIGDLPALRMRAEMLKFVIASYERYGKELSLVTGQLSAMSGLSAEKIGAIFSEQDVKITEGYATVFGMAIKTAADGVADIESLSQAQKNLLSNYVNIVSAVSDANSAFDAGSATAQTLAAIVAGTSSTLSDAKNNAKEYAEELIAKGVPASIAFSVASEQVNKLADDLEALKNKTKELEGLEAVGKGIASSFSSAITTLKDMSFKGTVDEFGKFAKTDVEVARNQTQLLLNTLESSLEAKQQYEQLLEEGKTVPSNIATAAANFDTAAKALTGSVIEKYQAVSKAAEQVSASLASIRNEAIQTVKELTAEQPIITAKFELDMSNLQRAAELAAQQQKIDLLQADIGIVGAKKDAGAITEREAAVQENSLQQQILQERRVLIEIEAQNSRDAIAQELEIARLEYEQRVAAIDVEAKLIKDKVDAEVKNLQNQIDIYNEFLTGYTTANNTLLTGITTAADEMSRVIGSTFQSAVNALSVVLGPFGAGTAKVETFTADLPELADIQSINDDLAASALSIRTEAAITKSVIDATTKAQKDAAQAELDRVVSLAGERLNAVEASAEAQTAALDKAAEAESYLADSRIKSAEAAGGSAETEEKLTYLQEKLKQLFDSIKGNIENALMGLNNLIFYGEGNFNEIMGNLFKSIQQDFFKTTIADPLSGFLTDSLFSMFDVKDVRTGIENAKVVGGALLVSVINGPADLLNIDPTKPIGDKDSIKGGDTLTESTKGIFGGFFDQITSLFTNIFGQNGILSGLFKGLFGQGGILSGLFSGIGGIFSGIFSFFGAAQGGLVHLAAGGAAASASLNRDRVPAMLEPGEFVIRKQSAERIGMPALQAMNATGGAPSGGNVFVNVSNEGSPKQAEASAPKFDGEKYVIDIVMRDIANNGPIRRSLRGRGGL